MNFIRKIESYIKPTDRRHFLKWAVSSTAIAAALGCAPPTQASAPSLAVNLKTDFGALGDNSTDDWAAVQACVDYCLQTGNAMYVPGGRYVLDQTQHGNQPIRLDNLTANGQGLKIYGDGPGVSVFVEADGATEAIGRYNKMFYFYSGISGPFGYDAGDFIFEDIGFDKNSSSNNAPPSPYAWEQAHAIAFNGNGTLVTDSVTFSRCGFFNKIGSYINHSGGNTVLRFEASSLSFGEMVEDKAMWGERGDLELSGANGINVVDAVVANYMQIEPVEAMKASPTNVRTTYISNSTIKTIQYGESASLRLGDSQYSTLYMENVTCEKELSLRNVNAFVDNSTVNLSAIWNSPRTLRCSNSTILLDYDPVTNEVTPVTIRLHVGKTDGLAEVYFTNGCEFKINSDNVLPGVAGYALKGLRTAGNAQTVQINVSNSEFDERLYGSIDGYGHGSFDVRDTKIAGHTRGVAAGSYSGYGSNVTLTNNDYSRCQGSFVHIYQNNALWSLEIVGSYLTTEWNVTSQGSQGTSGYQITPTLF